MKTGKDRSCSDPHGKKPVRRGWSPGDEGDFTGAGLRRTQKAGKDIVYLLDHGYPIKSAVEFCANHYLLSARQRMALLRSAAPAQVVESRVEKELNCSQCVGKTITIDGFNLIISLETFLAGSFLFRGMDGAIRDLAGLRGTYRLIADTPRAVACVARFMADHGIARAVFCLDSPVSNSGRLKSCIVDVWEELARSQTLPALDVQIIPHVDQYLKTCRVVATSDAIILDSAPAWINLGRGVMEEMGPLAPIVCPVLFTCEEQPRSCPVFEMPGRSANDHAWSINDT